MMMMMMMMHPGKYETECLRGCTHAHLSLSLSHGIEQVRVTVNGMKPDCIFNMSARAQPFFRNDIHDQNVFGLQNRPQYIMDDPCKQI